MLLCTSAAPAAQCGRGALLESLVDDQSEDDNHEDEVPYRGGHADGKRTADTKAVAQVRAACVCELLVVAEAHKKGRMKEDQEQDLLQCKKATIGDGLEWVEVHHEA